MQEVSRSIKKQTINSDNLIENLNFFWDIARQKYVELFQDTQEIRVIDQQHIKLSVYQKDQNYYAKNAKTLLLEVPQRFFLFDPLSDSIFSKNGYTYQNTYIPTPIMQKSKYSRVNEGLLTEQSDFTFLNKYPYINALLSNIAPKKEEKEHFLNWLSTALNTFKKTRTTYIFKGIQGTGKGVFWEQILQYCVGKNYTTTISNDDISSRFTPRGLDKALFVLANEIKGNFRDGNTAYEKLKMYITDDDVRVEEKGVQSLNVKTCFNMIFFSNHEIPVQIQNGDRRYSVIQTRSRKLDDVARSDFRETIDQFVKNIKNERDGFLQDLICYSFDKQRAAQTINNEEKERIYRASMTKIEILADCINRINFVDFINNDIAEIIEQTDEETVTKIANDCKILLFLDPVTKKIDIEKTIELILKDTVSDIIKLKKIKNSFLLFLYKIFVNSTDNQTKVGTALTTYFGRSRVSNSIRYRELENLKDEDLLLSKLYDEDAFSKYLPF